MRENKFNRIYHDLVRQIQEGELTPQQLLPSEHDLTVKYDASRETIRKALNLLSQNGYIQKVQGKGSIVLDVARHDFPVSGLVSFKELANEFGNDWQTKVEVLALIKADSFLQKELQASEEERVWKVLRSRRIQGERIILDKDFIKQSLVEDLSIEIAEDSLYAYFEKSLGLAISFAKKEITVEEATDEDQQYLDLDGHTHVVVVKNHVYLEDAALFQYTESRHRLDKFRFVDFARRERRK